MNTEYFQHLRSGKFKFWFVIASITVSLFIVFNLCFALAFLILTSYIYNFSPVFVSFLQRKIKDTVIEKHILKPSSQLLEQTIRHIASVQHSAFLRKIRIIIYILTLLTVFYLIYIVAKDQKPPYSQYLNEHIAVLIYFVIMPVCIMCSWFLYLTQLTLLNFLLYVLTANILNLSWDLKVALKELILALLIAAFSYLVFKTIVYKRDKIGMSFIFQLSLLPLLALGSYYIFIVVGSFGEGAWWIFIALMFGCIALSILLFVSGIMYALFRKLSSN